MEQIGLVTVAGTFGHKYPAWDAPNTHWDRKIRSLAFYNVGGERPFEWTNDLNGIRKRDWYIGGKNLYAWIAPPIAPDVRIPPGATHIVAYSFGGQVVLFGCAEGLRVNTLITIGMPVRDDMKRVTEAARRNIEYWICIHSDFDYTQYAGQGFRPPYWQPADPQADLPIQVMGGRHGDILFNSNEMDVWDTILDIVRRRHRGPRDHVVENRHELMEASLL